MESARNVKVTVTSAEGLDLLDETYADLDYEEDGIWRATTSAGEKVYIVPGANLMVAKETKE